MPDPSPTYSVVGVRADGTRLQLSRSVTRAAAEQALSLIPRGTEWREFQILMDDSLAAYAGPDEQTRARATCRPRTRPARG